MSKFDTSILDQNSKKAIRAIKDIDEIDHLNALAECERTEFEKPRSTVLAAIDERTAALAVDGGDDENDDENTDDENTDDGSESPAPAEKKVVDLTVGPAKLGRTARAVLDCVNALTNPAAPVDDEGNPAVDDEGDEIAAPAAVIPTASQVADALGVKTGQTRSILRTLRGRKLVVLQPALSPEDRTFRYKVADDAMSRVAEGDAERAKRNSNGRKAREKVAPMGEEEYLPLALKVGTLDRLIVRWSGTCHRERRAIDKEHGDGAAKEDVSHWQIRTVEIDGESVTGTGREIVSALRSARNKIMSDAAFNAAQDVEEGSLLVDVTPESTGSDEGDTGSDEGDTGSDEGDNNDSNDDGEE